MLSQITLTKVLLSLSTLLSLTTAHGLIIAAEGGEGGKGFALGVNPAINHVGAGGSQADTTVFKGTGTTKGVTGSGCGETSQGGVNVVANKIQAVISANGGLPQVIAGGALNMTYHQINGDGGGPIACAIDTTGTGNSFGTTLNLLTNVPGTNGNGPNAGKDQPLNVVLPANLKCTGTFGSTTGVCMVRCQNPAAAGPFGGCVPIQQANSAVAAPAKAVKPTSSAPAKSAQPAAAKQVTTGKTTTTTTTAAKKTGKHHHHPHGRKHRAARDKRSMFDLSFWQ